MPTEVTTGGVHKLSGLPDTLSAQKQSRVNVADAEVVRQELPPRSAPASSSNETIEKKVEDLNYQLQNLQRDLQFSIDADSGRTIIRVIDRETRETIRTIPPEDISVIDQSLERHSGVLFSTSV